MLNIRFLKFPDCPNAPQALEKLRLILDSEAVPAHIEEMDVLSDEQAKSTGFLGSPTIQINGYDIEPQRRIDKASLGCRIYQNESGPSGIPDESLITRAIRQAIAPHRTILFLCTGNSCRSQMAEGFARHLWGERYEVFSAGTEPRGLDSRAVRAMAEAGIDISNYRSKPVSELMDIPFDYVITLCSDAAENCPYFPGKARVFHKSFDDPPVLALTAATEEEAMVYYSRVRDEIRNFIESLPVYLGEQDSRQPDFSAGTESE